MKFLNPRLIGLLLILASVPALAQVVGQNTSGPTIVGPITTNDCVKWASPSSITDAGSACGSGGGGSAFNALTSGTNTTAAMLVGTGGSLGPTGSGTITANALSGSIAGTFTTLTSTGLANLGSGLTQAANTSVVGAQLIDSTAAAAASQQFSPAFLLEGKGWGTTGASSQPVDFKVEVQPVQSTVPTGNLVISSQVNGGGFTAAATLSNAGGAATQWLMPSGTATNPSFAFSTSTNTGMFFTATAVNFSAGGGNRLVIGTTGTTSQQKVILANNLESGGTAFTVASGTGACATTTTLVGGAIAGNFTCTGTTGASTVTLTMATAAAHAYECFGRDITTPTTVTQTGAISTTSVTLTLTSVTASDVIQFACPIDY